MAAAAKTKRTEPIYCSACLHEACDGPVPGCTYLCACPPPGTEDSRPAYLSKKGIEELYIMRTGKPPQWPDKADESKKLLIVYDDVAAGENPLKGEFRTLFSRGHHFALHISQPTPPPNKGSSTQSGGRNVRQQPDFPSSSAAKK